MQRPSTCTKQSRTEIGKITVSIDLKRQRCMFQLRNLNILVNRMDSYVVIKEIKVLSFVDKAC
jgi:hypothetical protein